MSIKKERFVKVKKDKRKFIEIVIGRVKISEFEVKESFVLDNPHTESVEDVIEVRYEDK